MRSPIPASSRVPSRARQYPRDECPILTYRPVGRSRGSSQSTVDTRQSADGTLRAAVGILHKGRSGRDKGGWRRRAPGRALGLRHAQQASEITLQVVDRTLFTLQRAGSRGLLGIGAIGGDQLGRPEGRLTNHHKPPWDAARWKGTAGGDSYAARRSRGICPRGADKTRSLLTSVVTNGNNGQCTQF